MAYFKHLIPIVASTTGLMAISPALAGDNFFGGSNDYFMSDTDFTATAPNENFVLRGSMGIAKIVGSEHVFAGSRGTDNLSLLLWDSTAPIGSLDAKVRLPGNWTLRGHIDVALPGDSTMTDYDWTGFSPSFKFNDWDHRSISPNTDLDWYLNGEIAIGQDLPVNDAFSVNVNGGFKYTDVEWTAVGGSFIYSDDDHGFRGLVGDIPNVAAVRYRQQLPTVFLGTDATIKDGAWSLEASGKAGVVIGGISTDWHYLRDPPRYTVDQLSLATLLSADAKLDYNFSDHLGAFIEGSYEKMFSGHTSTDYYTIADNSLEIHSDNIGGAGLDVMSIKAGLKGNF